MLSEKLKNRNAAFVGVGADAISARTVQLAWRKFLARRRDRHASRRGARAVY